MTLLYKYKIAVITSQFNSEITQKLEKGASNRISALNSELNITAHFFKVPGAVELPLISKLLAKTQNYDAIICLGVIIQGETDHYQYVCQQVSYGCQKVMLECEIPIVFGVLTTQNEQQALDRTGGKEGNKGKDAVDTALDMIRLIKSLNQ